LDTSKLHNDLKRKLNKCGAFNIDGHNPSRASTVLEGIGLNKEVAGKLSGWLKEIYETPEHAEEAISETLEKLT